MQRWLDRGDRALFIGALAILAFGAAGGAWGAASVHATMAGQLERSAQAPLYSALAGIAALLPIGEPWFRVAALNALLGAVLLVGVARAARALLPKDPVAGYAAALALALAPPFRDAAGFPGASILAACGVVWFTAFALDHARAASRDQAWRALAAIAVVVGSAPWLGLALGVLAVVWLRKSAAHDTIVLGIGAIGVLVVFWWFGAEGSLPELGWDLSATIESTGRGAAAVAIGAGLLGVAFAVVTDLPYARWLAAIIGIVALHAVIGDHAPVTVLASFAIGLAVIPSGIVRAVPSGGDRRHAVAALAGAPLIGAALLSGPAFSIDDPGHAPARVAFDLTVAVPAGPGVLATTRPQTWTAIAYAQRIAGARPDLQLAPVDRSSDAALADKVRAGSVVAMEVPALGRIDLRSTYPRGRAFLLAAAPPKIAERTIPSPAHYRSAIGEQLAVLFAVDRARYEAGHGRLGDAARAAGLTDRFGAADLAILSTAAPARPAFFGFIPALEELPPGRWLVDLLGDDLAWVAGIDPPVVEAPRARKLHALWRAMWRGEIKPDDPQITALGPAAVKATGELVDELKKDRE